MRREILISMQIKLEYRIVCEYSSEADTIKEYLLGSHPFKKKVEVLRPKNFQTHGADPKHPISMV